LEFFRTFGIFGDHLVHLYSLGTFWINLVHFFRCWYHGLRKIWQPVLEQGDQIGRIFAQWMFDYFGLFWKLQNYPASLGYFFHINFGLGYTVGDFFRKLFWSHCMASLIVRVTRLGDVSPTGALFSWRFFWKFQKFSGHIEDNYLYLLTKK
jgi:hypothetical protein